MEDLCLASQCNEYEGKVCSYLKLIDVYKNDTEKSKSLIIKCIEEACTNAVNSIHHLKTELIKDATSHLNEQVREYERYETDVNNVLVDVRKSAAEALAQPQHTQLTKSAHLKVDKAICSLEKPLKRVFSFIGQWERLSKCDLGVIVSDTAQQAKPHSVNKRPFRKKLQKHTSVRLPIFPALKGLTTFSKSQQQGNGRSNDQELAVEAMYTNRSQHQVPETAAHRTSDAMTVKLEKVANDSFGADHYDNNVLGTSSEDVSLIQSAVTEWALLSAVSDNESSGYLPTDSDTSHLFIPDQLDDKASKQDKHGSSLSEAAGNGSTKDIPSVGIAFSSLDVHLEGTPMIDEQDNGDNLNRVPCDVRDLPIHVDDITIPPAISRYLAKPRTNGVIHAQLTATLAGPHLGLSFPIGTCLYEGGLVVCNSGDSTVFHLKYEAHGEIISKTEVKGKFIRPSAVVVDHKSNLYIKDDKCIRRFNTDLEMVITFPNCFMKPYGLSLTQDNHLITMCDCGNGRSVPRRPSLLKFNTDGQLLLTLPLKLPLKSFSKLRFMDTSGDIIYISDLGASYVYMVDVNTGELIKVLAQPGHNSGSFREPSGIACDRDGNILIADSKANRIQIFDGNDGTYKGMLDCQGGLSRPSGIYLDSNDKLYAVNYIAHSVNIYELAV